MKLIAAQTQNYRSIVDTGIVNIDERATVLIGKNEQGKTSFLRALASFEPQSKYSAGDLPNHLRPMLEAKAASEIPITTLWFSFEPSDREKLSGVIRNYDSLVGVNATRRFDGGFRIGGIDKNNKDLKLEVVAPATAPIIGKIKSAAEQLRAKLKAHGLRLPAFAPYVPQAEQHITNFAGSSFADSTAIDNVVKTLFTALRGLPAQDQLIINDVLASSTEILNLQNEMLRELLRNPYALILAAMPKFIFHSSALDMIPNSVNVAQFVKDPLATSRGMANLCNVAGLSIQKIEELSKTAASQREAYEDHYRASISGAINEFWTQKSYSIHFRFESDQMHVSVSDDTYRQRIPPSERSDGFRWYLSFYCALLNDDSSARPNVVLLDNPGLELHPDGQRDIKRFLEQKLPSATQVIYVTHSPAMIDPFNLDQVRVVELKPEQQGTKISSTLTKGARDLDLLEPVRSAIGASLITSLILNDFNVITEGAADKPLMDGLLRMFTSSNSRINVNGSIAESENCMLAKFYDRARLPYVIFLDSDSAGRTIQKRLLTEKIPKERIIMLGEMFPDRGQEIEIEDIISPEMYLEAVKETYPEIADVTLTVDASKKIAKQYEEYFKTFDVGFSKKRVAEMLKKLVLADKADSVTKANLKKLADGIVERLKKTKVFINEA